MRKRWGQRQTAKQSLEKAAYYYIGLTALLKKRDGFCVTQRLRIGLEYLGLSAHKKSEWVISHRRRVAVAA